MLSDTGIKRDGNYAMPRRILLAARKRAANRFRPELNRKIRKKLEGIEFSVFSNNCLGGVFYHDAGRKFTSPTINTALDGEDFIRFLERPEYYLSAPMEFVSYEGHHYPIARIDDIEVRFVHYKTPEEAQEKWQERGKRIVWDNLFIVATNHDGMSRPDLMERFNALPYENKIMFVSREYPQYPWAVLVPQFEGRFQVRIMTAFANFKGERYYESCYDLADWIQASTHRAKDRNEE